MNTVSAGYGWGRQKFCKRDKIEIQVMDCRLHWDQECATSQKKAGERVVYEKKCENREVKACNRLQFSQLKNLG